MTKRDTILETAIAWHLASERDDMDWAGFIDWLEADDRHREVYDEVALSDHLARAHSKALAASLGEASEAEARSVANDVEPIRSELPGNHRLRRFAPWVGGAIAASLVAMTLVPILRAPAPVVYATDASARTIALEDGSRIELAPRSRLTIEGRNHDQIALNGGAWFEIRHDPDRLMTISAGEVTIRDIGTSFDVQQAADQVRVEVAEGVVSVDSPLVSQPIRLAAGRAFRLDSKRNLALTSSIDKSEAGEWRTGRLSYDTAPLGLVAADLARYAGVKVTVANGVENLLFSGTLALDDGEAALRDLAQLMELDLERTPDGYRLVPTGR